MYGCGVEQRGIGSVGSQFPDQFGGSIALSGTDARRQYAMLLAGKERGRCCQRLCG